jgi:hypothetical protein
LEEVSCRAALQYRDRIAVLRELRGTERYGLEGLPGMTTSDAVWAAVAVAALLSIPAICLWLLVEGLRNGVVRTRLGSYSRADEAIWFWSCIALYAAVAAWTAYVLVRVAFL